MNSKKQSKQKVNSRNDNQELKQILLGSGIALADGVVIGAGVTTLAHIINGKIVPPPTPLPPTPPNPIDEVIHHDTNGYITPHINNNDPTPPIPPIKYEVNEISQESQVVEYNGQEVTVVSGRVNGHNAIFIDQNSDEIADIMIIDENDNGRFDDDEEVSVHESGIGDIHVPHVPIVPGFSNVHFLGTNEYGNIYTATYTNENGEQFNAQLFDIDCNGTYDVAEVDGAFISLSDAGERLLSHNTLFDDELHDAEFSVTNYQHHTQEDGQDVDFIEGTVNGHMVRMFDTNHDGFIDHMWYDHNDDQIAQPQEMINMHQSEYQIDLNGTDVYTAMHNGEAVIGTHATLFMAQNSGNTMDNYNNHADISCATPPEEDGMENLVGDNLDSEIFTIEDDMGIVTGELSLDITTDETVLVIDDDNGITMNDNLNSNDIINENTDLI